MLVLDAPLASALPAPPPHRASSLLTTREGSGGSLGWGLPAWAAQEVKAEASHPTPHAPPARRTVRGLTCAAGKGRPWDWS